MSGPAPRVGVIGLGLVGGSLLRKLTAMGVATSGWDSDHGLGSAVKASGLRVADDLATLARESDVVFVAVPLPAVAACVLDALRAAPEVVVSDTGSAKRSVMDAVLAGGGAAERFVGGHPLAGSEQAGFRHSREELFERATWALCPGAASLASLVAVASVVEMVGARVVVVEPSEHDAAVARSSHLAHLVAALLAREAGSGLEAALSGGALRDATRTAEADVSLWLDILRSNAREVLAAAGAFGEGLAALGEGGWEGVLRDGALARERILAARWSSPEWEAGAAPVQRWRETLLALGAEGRAVRRLRVDGDVLRYEVALSPRAGPALR